MEENIICKRVLYLNLGTTRLTGRPRNTRQNEVREGGRIVGGEWWQEKVHNGEEKGKFTFQPMNVFWYLEGWFLCRASRGRELGWKTHLFWNTGVDRTRYVIIRTKSVSRQKKIIFYAFFWEIPRRLNFICRRFGTLSLPSSYLTAYEDGTECSETTAYKIQTPGNYPEENIQHLEHGKSLK